MQPRQARAPRIVHRAADFGGGAGYAGMRQGDGLFGSGAGFIRQAELHVDGVRVAQRNGGLQPFEHHLELAAERIGAGFELAEMEHLRLSYNGAVCSSPNSLPLVNSDSWN